MLYSCAAFPPGGPKQLITEKGFTPELNRVSQNR